MTAAQVEKMVTLLRAARPCDRPREVHLLKQGGQTVAVTVDLNAAMRMAAQLEGADGDMGTPVSVVTMDVDDLLN